MRNIIMGLFGKKFCGQCGEKTNVLTRNQLSDGTYLCSNCSRLAELYFGAHFMDKLTFPEYQEYLSDREENRKRLEDFNITAVYFNSVYVDEGKDWIVFDYFDDFNDKESMLKQNPTIFEAKDLIYFDFRKIFKDVKEGFLNDKVIYDMKLVMAFDNRWYPYSFAEKVRDNYKVKAEITGIINKSVECASDEEEVNLLLYLSDALTKNGRTIPMFDNDDKAKNIDLEEYSEYFTRLFVIKRLIAKKNLMKFLTKFQVTEQLENRF